MSKVVLSALLSTVYKMDDGEIAEALKDADDLQETSKADDKLISLFKEKDTVRVKEFKDQAKKRFDDGHKKGKSETMEAFESSLREEYEVEDETLKGIDLVKHITAETIKKDGGSGTGKKGEITEDVIKKHPVYLDLDKKLKQREKDLLKEKEDAVKNVQSEYKKKETEGTVKSKALTLLEEMNPVLPEDKTKANRQKELFIKELLATNKVEIADDGTILILGEDGSPQTDAHGNTVSFDEFVKNLATTTFEFPTVEKKSAPGNGGKKDAVKKNDGKTATKVLPKAATLDEVSKLMDDQTYTLAERQTIFEEYNKANGGK